MTKIRVLVFLLTLFVIITAGTVAALYARGFRFNTKDMRLSSNGLMVLKSVPDSAQVYINGELKTATNTTLSLQPGTYDVDIKKAGFKSWYKRLVVDKEVVTEATAQLFKSVPSLSPFTFSETQEPTPSWDFNKIAYIVPPNTGSDNQIDGSGLWVIEMVNLPLGFSREPKKVTDGNLQGATWIWSPDGREILLTTKVGTYLLNVGTFTSQAQRTNIAATKDTITKSWDQKRQTKKASQLKKLPDRMQEVLVRRTSSYDFSPDEDMVLYTASSAATIEDGLIKPIPGSSTQKQERNIKPSHTYVYDIKEDRNFLIDADASNLVIEGGKVSSAQKRISWFPTSRNLIIAEPSKITICDYDGTNHQEVYSGSYVSPYAFPMLSQDGLIILTNLGASSNPANLYSLTLR